MTDLLSVAEKLEAPWLLVLALVLAMLIAVLRVAAELSETAEKALGPLGKRWAKSRDQRIEKANQLVTLQKQVDDQAERIEELTTSNLHQAREIEFLRRSRDADAWRRDLEIQVEKLTELLAALRGRNIITDAYLIYDAAYHRTVELGGPPPPHVGYVQFERNWIADHAPDEGPTTVPPTA